MWLIDQLVVLMMWPGSDGICLCGLVAKAWSASYTRALTGNWLDREDYFLPLPILVSRSDTAGLVAQSSKW